jgi:hypothetical protein
MSEFFMSKANKKERMLYSIKIIKITFFMSEANVMIWFIMTKKGILKEKKKKKKKKGIFMSEANIIKGLGKGSEAY